MNLMDLSKAFETINNHLQLAKLYTYGFSEQGLFVKLKTKEKDQ